MARLVILLNQPTQSGNAGALVITAASLATSSGALQDVLAGVARFVNGNAGPLSQTGTVVGFR